MKAIRRPPPAHSDPDRQGAPIVSALGTKLAPLIWLIACLFSLLLGPERGLAQDLAVTRIVTPVSGCQLGDAETVSVEIQNFGTAVPGGSIYRLSYQVGNLPANEEVILRGNPLPSMATFRHTFSFTGANLQAEGLYTLRAQVSIDGETNPANDILDGVVVENFLPSVGGTPQSPSAVADAGAVTLQGHHGAIVEWQISPDGLRWLSLENQSASQGFSNLEAPNAFRALVQNGRCAAALSSAHWVSPDHMFEGDFE
ncbi:hypothetical protein C7S18_04710 [Ahniella affigens]|uniref:CARDB domain-containing protein n=1 Tax=Ahniella affigens TaxID=2021234 RepID=A0A2P1PNW9_9GAMM|nr:hypothetical protein [Ahniella affigens]AVP96542.1 hypothetical protein C7S18_04710 [Ahniella affigens]